MNVEIKISSRKIPYKLSLKYLEKRVNDVKLGKKKDLIWLLEHPLIFTGGINPFGSKLPPEGDIYLNEAIFQLSEF